MKKNFFSLSLASLLVTSPVMAGTVAGTGGATEYTQILNQIQLADAFAQDALRYQNEIMRYEIMAKNMINNPMGVSGPNLGLLIRNQERIMALGQDIGSSVSKVDENFAKQFKSPQAGDFGVKFKMWTNTSLDGLKAAMENNGLHRENFKNDNAALEALATKVQASEGNLAAAKTLGEVNVAQLGESIKLRDLLSQQQQAVNTYMASQVSKDQAKQDVSDKLWTLKDEPITKATPRQFDPKRF